MMGSGAFGDLNPIRSGHVNIGYYQVDIVRIVQ